MQLELSADIGEGLNNEETILPFLNACNIACGGHAGDKKTIEKCLNLAQKHSIKIGAHPSYPDKENFGRVSMDIEHNTLKEQLLNQLDLFFTAAKQNNSEVHHIKPHGALYHDIAKQNFMAELFKNVLEEMRLDIALVLPYNAPTIPLFESDFRVMKEAFIDRKYHTDYSLVSRNNPDGLIYDVNEAYQQLKYLSVENKVQTIEGEIINLEADVFCMHGDHPNVVEILTKIHNTCIKND